MVASSIACFYVCIKPTNYLIFQLQFLSSKIEQQLLTLTTDAPKIMIINKTSAKRKMRIRLKIRESVVYNV